MDAAKRQTLFEILYLVVLICAGLALRWPAIHVGLNCDESHSMYVATRSSLAELLQDVRWVDYNPPGAHILNFIWAHFAGSSEVIAKVPVLIYGLLLIPATYWLGLTATEDRGVARLSAFFAAFSCQSVYFSSVIKAYSLTALIACSATAVFCPVFVRKKWGLPGLLAFLLLSVALVYTSYAGVVYFAVLSLSALAAWFFNRQFRIKEFMLCALLTGASFLFWAPTFLEQMRIGHLVDQKTPLHLLPLSVLSNLITMLPLPWWNNATLLAAVSLTLLAWTLVWAFKQRKNGKTWAFANVSVPPSGLLLLIALVVAGCGAIAYTAPFFLGYYRYIFPFAAAGWVVYSALFMRMIQAERLRSAPIRHALAAVSLGLIIALNIAEVINMYSQPRSGSRQLAQELKDGKWDYTCFLYAPEYSGNTFSYYAPAQILAEHNSAVEGFVISDVMKPIKNEGYPQAWQDGAVVSECVEKVQRLLSGGKYRRLAFVRCKATERDTPQVPTTRRINELVEQMKSTFEDKGSKCYPARAETLELTVYVLK
ncbi:MAG TPA: hypothetical protein V6D17_21300 [Candidatus Obscuribacterales bacterium]